MAPITGGVARRNRAAAAITYRATGCSCRRRRSTHMGPSRRRRRPLVLNGQEKGGRFDDEGGRFDRGECGLEAEVGKDREEEAEASCRKAQETF